MTVTDWGLVGLDGLTREALFGLVLGRTGTDAVFYLCGAVIGGAGGALQAASRTMMVRHTRPEKSAEAFGLYALSGKATAFLAPALVGLVTGLSGSQNIGISPLIALFILSLALLVWVASEGETA